MNEYIKVGQQYTMLGHIVEINVIHDWTDCNIVEMSCICCSKEIALEIKCEEEGARELIKLIVDK